MFSTSTLYFLVTLFGKSIESSEAHGLQLVEGQENETTEPNLLCELKFYVSKISFSVKATCGWFLTTLAGSGKS